MPGRDYTRAYELLRESAASDLTYPSLTPTRSSSGTYQTSSNGSARSLRSRVLQVAAAGARSASDGSTSSTLPGAPQIRVSGTDPSFGLSGYFQSSDRSSSTRPSTPFNQRLSASPDSPLTPPSLHSGPAAKHAHGFYDTPSNQASFLTANEYIHSTSSLEHDRKRTSRIRMQPLTPTHGQGNDTAFSEPVLLERQIWSDDDTETIRGGRRRDRPLSNFLTFLDDADTSDMYFQNFDSPGSWFESESPVEDGDQPRTPPPKAEDKQADYVNMTPPKRLPSATKKPAVISAEIRESPQSAQRNDHHLRHFRKHEFLRLDSLTGARQFESLEDAPDDLDDQEATAEPAYDVPAPESPATAPKSASREPEEPLEKHSERESTGEDDVARVDAEPPNKTGQPTAHEIRAASLSALLSAHRSSPLSEISDSSLFHDARAIRIASHNNRSLLLVHSGRSSSLPSDRFRDAAESLTARDSLHPDDAAQLASQQAAPKTRLQSSPALSHTNLTSTLEPQTPNVDIDTVPERTRRPILHRDLSRHASLIRRAVRTFSGTNMPFGSARRSNSSATSGSRPRRAASSASASASARDRSDHPFWQPREFWSDVKTESGTSSVDGSAATHADVPAAADGGAALGGARDAESSLRQAVIRGVRRRRAASYPDLRTRDVAGSENATSESESRSKVSRIASLKRAFRPGSVAAAATPRTRSQRRRLTAGFKEKILEGTRKRQERRRREELDMGGGDVEAGDA